ncbi:MAG TPA: hypothetical protein PLO15_03365 [Propionicimonas sp.]|nr:hypothetical protein [Propionicimonas sp.]
MSSARPWHWYEARLSSPRLAHYLAATGSDPDKAIALYEWNARVSAAFWEEFSYFEVAFRNALDSRMAARHRALGRPGHWIFDDTRELGRDARGAGQHNQPYRDVAEAMRRVRINRKPTDPGQIISEISFGFWHQLVSKRHVALWPDLASGFPNAPRRNQALVREPVARLRDFRNRIGHHHRVWALDVAGRHQDVMQVARYIDVTCLTGSKPTPAWLVFSPCGPSDPRRTRTLAALRGASSRPVDPLGATRPRALLAPRSVAVRVALRGGLLHVCCMKKPVLTI